MAVPSGTGQYGGVIHQASFFCLEDMFDRAKIPVYQGDGLQKGTVCLGEQPLIMDLDKEAIPNEILGEGIEQPKFLNRDRIMNGLNYTKWGEATVRAKVLVDEHGRVIRYQFEGDRNADLEAEITPLLSKMLFMPGQKNHQPEKWWVIVPFRFGQGC